MFATAASRLARLAVAPVLVAGGLALAQPALATDYCVAPNDTCGGVKLQDFQAALDAAAADSAPDRIFLGAFTYTAPAPGFVYDPQNGGPVEIAGAGQGQTTLAGANGAYRTLAVFGGTETTVHDLRVKMPPTAPDGAQALRTNGVVRNVSVVEDWAQQSNTRTGVVLLGDGVFEHGTIGVSTTGNQPTTGIVLAGGGTVRDSIVYGSGGVTSGGGTIERSQIGARSHGVDVQHGTTRITSTRIQSLETGSVGVTAGGTLDGDAVVEVDGVTMIGPDDQSSGTGISIYNAYVPTAKIDLVLKNSIIRSYPTSLWVGGDAPGHAHVTASYSDYDSSTKTVVGATGTLDESNISYVGNVFDDEDLVPRADSPLVDAGDPATAQGLDLNGNPLVTDGNGDGIARRDIGAVELTGVPYVPPAPDAAPAGGDQPAAPPVSPSARDTLAPALSGVRLSRKVFTVGNARTAISAGTARGACLSYALSENAKVVIGIQRIGKKRAAGKLIRTATAGRNSVRFSGRIGAKALRPGRYRASVVAIDAAGNRSAAKTVRFRIAKR